MLRKRKIIRNIWGSTCIAWHMHVCFLCFVWLLGQYVIKMIIMVAIHQRGFRYLPGSLLSMLSACQAPYEDIVMLKADFTFLASFMKLRSSGIVTVSCF